MSFRSNIFGQKNTAIAPFTLSDSAVYPTTAVFSWTPPVTETLYPVVSVDCFINGILFKSNAKTNQSYGRLTPDTAYSIQMIGYDNSHNWATESNIINITTPVYIGAFNIAKIWAYYKCDDIDGTGAINDYVGANNGTDISLIKRVPGKVGFALRANRDLPNGRFFSVTGIPYNVNDRSWNFWVRRTDVNTPASGTDTGVFYGGGSATHYPWTDGKMYIGMCHPTRVSFSNAVDRTQWHMVTVTKDNLGNWKMYQNANLVSSASGVGNATTAGSALFGVSNVGSFMSNSEFCEISYHTEALTQTDIDFYYNGGVGRTLDF